MNKPLNKDLDAQFGRCISATRVDDWEKLFRPKSLFELNATTAPRLKALMALVEANFYLSHCLYSEFLLIWLIDERGSLNIAVEEGLRSPTEDVTYPLPKKLNPRPPKLGHPTLIGASIARIGGELLFNPDARDELWILNNKSGRFGLASDRTEKHLENVAKVFERYDISVTAKFTRPTAT